MRGSRRKPAFRNVAQCAIEEGYEGCWECAGFAACSKMDFLTPVHGDAHIENMRKISRVGVEEWAAGSPLWYSPPLRIGVEKGD